MTDADTDLSQERFPWLRSGFALEGWVGALAAWLAGILLGIIWGPLFWIGFVAAVGVLLATRTVKRAPPRDIDVVVGPIDGVVESINTAVPPPELKLDGDNWTRIRISKGPPSPVGLYAPMDGALDHVVTELGDSAAFSAMRPDRPGLSAAFVSFESGTRTIGMRLATGGLGPRLEISSEPGDGVRVGRQIGLMRLGGWCDVYLPVSTDIRAWPGQTLVAAETVIAKFVDAPASTAAADSVVEAEADKPSEPDTADAAKEAAPAPAAKKRAPRKRKATAASSAKSTTKADETKTDQSPVDADTEEEDVSDMLARLRAESDDVDDPKPS